MVAVAETAAEAASTVVAAAVDAATDHGAIPLIAD